MRVIQINEDKKCLWNSFVENNCRGNFLQSWEWGSFQNSVGRKIWRLAVIKDGALVREWGKTNLGKQETDRLRDLLAVSLIVKHDLPFGRNYLYCPRGPIASKKESRNERSKILDTLFKHLKSVAFKEKSLFLRIDPQIEERTKTSINELRNKKNGIGYIGKQTTLKAMRDMRKKIAFKEYIKGCKFKKSPSEIQPKDTLILDLAQTEDSLMRRMKQKTRYNIRLARKKRVNVSRALDYKKCFSDFWALISETSKRNRITLHDREYYFKMLESLSLSWNNKKCLRSQAVLYLAEYNGEIIAANIVLFFGNLCVYLHGASSDKHRNTMATYLLQWKQILDAKSMGCKTYDFWGITIDNKKREWFGITRFKKGFGGNQKSYIGAYDLIFNKSEYALYKFAKVAKRAL